MNALRLCFGLLTVLPVRALPQVDRRTAAGAMLLAPLAVLPFCLLAVGAHLLGQHTNVPGALLAVLLLLGEVVLTRAVHLDGLADTVDGLGSGKAAPDALRIMKASDVGPFGVVAIVLVLLLQVVCLAALLPTWSGTVMVLLAWLTSRQALAWACREEVPAATGGLGSLVAGTVPTPAAAALALALAAGSAAVGALLEEPLWHGLAVVLAGVATALLVVRRCRRRLGGVTGDVFGAVVEASLTVALVTAAVLVTA